ncbi:MAG TPA: VTT domain-containing protein [Gemmatimonadaceae bacterium]|jgi:membrane protein DedA with SNARE-associated domain/membrane-associated phospholipid phosphatase
MLDVVSQWVAHYGYALVGAFLLVEAAGLPVPGETALVTAAALAGRGTLSLVGVIIAGLLGTILGGHAGYWIGARGGHAVVTRYGRYVGLNEKRLEQTHTFFAQHGAKTVLLGRFVAFIRSFVGIFAGLNGMSVPTFAFYNALGGATWVATFSILGYAFGRNLPRLVHYIGRVSLLVAILIALVAGVVFFWRWFAKHRTEVVARLDEDYVHAAQTPRMNQLRVAHPRAFSLVTGRFAQSEYLGLHLLIGFLLSLTVIGVFASITEGLLDSSPLTRFDIAIATRLQQAATPEMLTFFDHVSSLGGRGLMTVFLFGGVVIYAARRHWLDLAGWAAAFIGASLLDAALRAAVRRSELPFADIALIDWGTGLTSGHALGVLVGYGMLAYLGYSVISNTIARSAIIVLAASLIAAITVARLYLGQHYISDATAGLAAGLIWWATCVSGVEIARSRHWRR